MATGCGQPDCRLCGADADVILPKRLIEDLSLREAAPLRRRRRKHRGPQHGASFYERIRSELTIGDEPDFPDLMSTFVAQYSRNELVERFLQHLLYKKSFPTLSNRISEFHYRISVNPFIREIITTNWDDLFERITGAVPLVVGEDFAFWDAPVRKVLKIHGSILNPGTIVATREEYDRSLLALRSGAIGTAAKLLIATRTVVFVGYSYRDDDIRQMIDALRTDLSSAARKCYFVHPDPDFVAPLQEAEVIRTSARHFVRLLDDALVNDDVLLPRNMYDRVDRLVDREVDARARGYRLQVAKHPLEIYDCAYRDRSRLLRAAAGPASHG